MEIPSSSTSSSSEVNDIAKPRMYADVNVNNPDIFKTPEHRDFSWTNMDQYEWCTLLGTGAFSDVYIARKRRSLMNKEYALKIAKPDFEVYLLKELKFMYHMGKNNRIPKLVHPMAWIKNSKLTLGMLLEMPSKETLESIEESLTHLENQHYLYQILEGLNFCHSKGIMHRDVKPDNIIVNRRRRKAYLIDWGSAEFYLPRKYYDTHVGSR